jgi:hypothetical protein
LHNRISIGVGINTLGLNKYFTRLFHGLGITMMPNNVRHYLDVKEKNRTKRIDKCKTKGHKKDRNKTIFEKLWKAEVLKRQERKKKEGTYRTGMALDDDCDRPARKRPRTSNHNTVCKHCGLTAHSRITSKHCLQHKGPKEQPRHTVPTAASLPAKEDLDSEDQAKDLDQYEGLLLLVAARPDNNREPAADNTQPKDAKNDDCQILNTI